MYSSSTTLWSRINNIKTIKFCCIIYLNYAANSWIIRKKKETCYNLKLPKPITSFDAHNYVGKLHNFNKFEFYLRPNSHKTYKLTIFSIVLLFSSHHITYIVSINHIHTHNWNNKTSTSILARQLFLLL